MAAGPHRGTLQARGALCGAALCRGALCGAAPSGAALWGAALLCAALSAAACSPGVLSPAGSVDATPDQQVVTHDGPAPTKDSWPVDDGTGPQPDAAPQPDSEPPEPGLLGVGGIVGSSSYSIGQDYGPTDPSWGSAYDYCHAYGNWPSGTVVHCGLDVTLTRGTPLHSPAKATVTTAGGTGYYADISNAQAGDLRLTLEDGTIVILGHSSELLVSLNETVTKGQTVSKSGTSPNGAPHLHLEVRVKDSSMASGYKTVDPLVYFGP